MKQPAGKYFCSKNTRECSNLLETMCYTVTQNMPVLWHPYNCGLMCSFSQKIFRLLGLKELAHWCWTTTDSQRAPAALSIHSGRKKPNPLEHSSFFWTIKLSLSLSMYLVPMLMCWHWNPSYTEAKNIYASAPSVAELCWAEMPISHWLYKQKNPTN